MQKDEKLMQFLEKGITNKIGEKLCKCNTEKLLIQLMQKIKNLSKKSLEIFFI